MINQQWGRYYSESPLIFWIILAKDKQNSKLDEILWVISHTLREPIAVLLKDEFWITTVYLEIANINILFAYGRGEDCYLPIVWMDPEQMPPNVPGELIVNYSQICCHVYSWLY